MALAFVGVAIWTIRVGVSAPKNLADVVVATGFTPYSPPSSIGGPGYVFFIEQTDQEYPAIRSVCRNAFPEHVARVFDVSLPELKRSSSLAIDAAAKIAGRSEEESAELSANGSIKRNVGVIWGPTQVHELVIEDFYSTSPITSTVSKPCHRALKDLKQRDPKRRLMIVVKALRVKDFTFEFELEDSGSQSAAAAFYAWLKGKGSVSVAEEESGIIRIRESRFLGYNVAEVSSFVPSSLMGPDRTVDFLFKKSDGI